MRIVKTIRKAGKITGKKILLRVDFNVPVKNGRVMDEYKIVQQLPTIRYLLRHRCRIIILTHLGRPGGKRVSNLTVKPIAGRLSKILGVKVKFVDTATGFKPETASAKIKEKEIVMLENIRFEPGEEKNSAKLARNLAKLADIYINDALGVSHRAQASVFAIKNYLPSYAGLLIEKEIKYLEKVKNPKKPLILIIGGAKMNTKIRLIKNFQSIAHRILIGGALANNFFDALGLEVGKSLIDKESVKIAKKCSRKNIILPVDVITSATKAGKNPCAKSINDVSRYEYIYDIGPKTISLYASFIKKASTIIWNGPLGKFENAYYKHGTLAIATLIAARSSGKAFGLAGGGETVEALKETKMFDHVDWVSTGGGAMLSYLSGISMPGLTGLIR